MYVDNELNFRMNHSSGNLYAAPEPKSPSKTAHPFTLRYG